MTAQSPAEVFALLNREAAALVAGAATAGQSTVSMPSTYPAFHLNKNQGDMPEEATMTPGGTRSGREFAHIHTEFKDDEHADVVVAKRRGEPWQAYQGGGQGSMHLCVSLRDAAEVHKDPALNSSSNSVLLT